MVKVLALILYLVAALFTGFTFYKYHLSKKESLGPMEVYMAVWYAPFVWVWLLARYCLFHPLRDLFYIWFPEKKGQRDE